MLKLYPVVSGYGKKKRFGDDESLDVDSTDPLYDPGLDFVDPGAGSKRRKTGGPKLKKISSGAKNNDEKLFKKVVQKSGVRVYVCGECPFTSKRMDRIREHGRSHTKEKPISCHLCSYRTGYPSALRRHLTTHDDLKRIVCPHEGCEKRFRVKADLTKHYKNHDEGRPRPHPCPEPGCDKSFHVPSLLKSHSFSHSSDRPIECPKCDYRCKNKNFLRGHMESHNPPDFYKCKFCSFSCKYRMALKIHLNNLGNKPHPDVNRTLKCGACPLRFPTVEERTAHMIVHSNSKLTCLLCNFNTFKTKVFENHMKNKHKNSNLNSGMNVRVFPELVCILCLTKFETKAKLSEHLIQHENGEVFAPQSVNKNKNGSAGTTPRPVVKSESADDSSSFPRSKKRKTVADRDEEFFSKANLSGSTKKSARIRKKEKEGKLMPFFMNIKKEEEDFLI